jgi:glycyl-tRNA synthetase
VEKEGLDSALNLMSRRGMIMPSAQIYGEVGGFYDYGPIGLKIKKRIEALWRRRLVEGLGNLEIETSLIAPEQVFRASGHLETFADPVSVCKKCGYSHRADKMLAEFYERRNDKAKAEAAKHANLNELKKMILDAELKCERCGAKLEDVEMFNLMLATKVGSLGSTQSYLRPETAQGTFLDFKNIFKIYGLKLPIGIGQSGKAFRNEISPRNILVRMREFSQMELEYFFDPEEKDLAINGKKVDEGVFSNEITFASTAGGGDESVVGKVSISKLMEEGHIPNKLFGYLLYQENEFMKALGFDDDAYKFVELSKDELPHYSKGNVDLEAKIGGKYEELAGTAYRTDFDLKNHETLSKEDMHVFNNDKKVMPHVVEFAMGLDRTFLALISNSLYKDDKRGWEVLRLNESITPYDFALFPLQRDDKLMDKSAEIRDALLKKGYSVFYSYTGSIGKRYARADEIGINRALTVDYDTLNDGSVTVRDMLTTSQERIKVDSLL